MPAPSEPPAIVLDLRPEGPLDRATVPQFHQALQDRLRGIKRPEVRLDLSAVTSMDSAGAALCHVVQTSVVRAGGTLRLVGTSAEAREALSLFRVRDADATDSPPPPTTFFERLGGTVAGAWTATVELLVLFTDTLHYTVLGIFGRHEKLRGATVVEQMVRIGLESLGIVSLISLLVGLTVALQSAFQLRQFGANIYIADLIGIAMTREMGPLMTAILIAGRCGSSVAAEISTMVITEEVDALKVMGVNPVRYLVVPRFLAITITQPLLTVMADVLGILGGFFIAVTYLQVGATPFLDQLTGALQVKDILTGLVKSVAFAWIIVFVGAHRGFSVHGGAEGVGRATTSSVVQAIFLVIAADAFFSLLFYFGE